MAEGLRARTKRKASYFEQESDDEEYEEVKEMEDDDFDWEEPVRKSKSEDFCTICKTGGKVLCCDSCTAVFHLECLDPPMKAVPKGSWSCPSCVEPLAAIEKFLDCEMRPLETSPADEEAEPVKQYLVKWKTRSYLHCSWIPLAEIERAAKVYPGIRMKLNHFNRQWSELKEAKDTEEYVPIRPEWVTVDRIIDRRDKGEAVEYLVKWKELGYDEATWEVKKDLQAFQSQIGKYKRLMAKGTRKTKKKSEYKIQSGFAHYAETPRFLADGLSLHPYQLEGLNFLRFAWQQEKHVILADEMGLGKTVQSIAFLASLAHEGVFDPHLVVAPLSTLRNWEREFATWAPHIQIVVYAGNASARTIIRDTEFYYPKPKDGKMKKRYSEKKQSKQDRIKFDVLLTSYEMITTDATILKSIKWECLIVDEGHRLKSKDSKLFQTLQTFTTHHRVLLTGTPLQNNLDELFTLMHFLDADKFASLEDFQQEFRNINQEEQVVRLHKMLASHLLRRVKKDVLKQLPPKKELMLRVELSSMQKEYYKAILTRNYEVLGRPGAPQISLNNVVMELRKLCGHPFMIDGVEPEYKSEDEGNRQRIEASGKLLLLDKMMVKLKEKGHRVLIYSQFQRMLDILEDWLTSKKWNYERIDGSVSGAERQIRIDRYNAPNSNRFCFLLSTRAGGLGINLATADTVIIYDSDWNPHADLQAMARAHRLGQKNMVMIYRLVARGSIEERMMQMTKKKMVLEHLVVGRIKQTLKQEELDDILRYGAKSVFADENDESAKAWQIHYDDAAIDRLLVRSETETGHEMPQEEEDNDLLKAFKVANFEYVNNAIGRKEDANREAEADYEADHLSVNDRMQYWENLLKDRYEKEQAAELGKGKRTRKPIKHGEDDLAGMQYTSSEGEDSDDHMDMDYKEVENRRKNYTEASVHKIMEGDGKSLKVLGFRRKHRALFVQLLMRFGLGDLTWSAFFPHFEQKSLEEIQAYGTLFLKHISGHNDDSPKFPDGVPKEGLRVKDVCVRLAVLHLIEMKLHQCWQSPNMKLFSDAIYTKFPALRSFYFWKEDHDRALLEGIMKHGYGCWIDILEDSQYGLQSVVREELKRVFSTEEETEVHMTTKRTVDFIKKRMCLLESALHSEHQLEDQSNQDESPVEHNHKEFNTELQMFNQTSNTFGPFPSPLSPEDVAAAALDNDPKRLNTAKLYNDMCSLVAENRNDAFQAYAGNKSAGVRLRKSIRQLDQICSEMRKGLGAKADSSDGAQAADRDDISDIEVDAVRVKVVTID